MTSTCEHRIVKTFGYEDGHGWHPAVWACEECRLRFSPGRTDMLLDELALRIEDFTEPHGGEDDGYLRGKEYGLRLAAGIVRAAQDKAILPSERPNVSKPAQPLLKGAP